MNERIKELAIEHGYIKWNNETHQFEFAGDICEVLEFAELVVKECAEIAAVDSETIGDRIKDEFGME